MFELSETVLRTRRVMVSKITLLLSSIAFCALSLPIKAEYLPDSEDEVERVFGATLEENIDMLKDVIDTAISIALETLRNTADAIDKSISKLATEYLPRRAKIILDFGKVLLGLKADLDQKNIPTNICLIDEAVKKIDTLPNDVGRQVQICKKTVAAQVSAHIDKTLEHFNEATAESAELARAGVECLRETNLACVAKVAVRVGAAILQIPNRITRHATATVKLLNGFLERGEICLTKAIERTVKKATRYVDEVEVCLKKHKINSKLLVN